MPLWILIAVRFLFGMGEAARIPTSPRLAQLVPFSQRGFAQGVVWMSGRLMGGITPLIWLLLVRACAARWLILGAADQRPGAGPAAALADHVLAVRGAGRRLVPVFAFGFATGRRKNGRSTQGGIGLYSRRRTETQAAHAGVPWRKILLSRNLWIVCLMYTCHNFSWVFYLTYLPNFLKNHYGANSGDVLGAIYKGGPLWMGAVGCVVGGFLTDWLIRRTGNRRWGRRVFGLFGNLCASACFLLCPCMSSAFCFFLAITLAGFFTDLTMGSNWAVCQDIGRRYAAIVAGCMNMIGNLGGTTANWITGYFIQRSLLAHAASLGVDRIELLSAADRTAGELHGYHVAFYLFAAVYVLGALCWLFIDPTKPVAPDEAA